MNWSDIFNYYYGWEIPGFVKSSITILMVIMIIITGIQFVLSYKTKSQKFVTRLLAICFMLMTIITGIIAIKTANKEAWLYHNIVYYANYLGKPIYNLSTYNNQYKLSNFQFTYAIYRLLSIVISIAYGLIVLSIKSKKISSKIICGFLSAIILVGGLGIGCRDLKISAMLNKKINEYYEVPNW